VAAPAANLSRRTGTGSPERADPDPVRLCQLAGAALDPDELLCAPVFKTTGDHPRRPDAYHPGCLRRAGRPASALRSGRVAPGGMAEGMTGRVPDPPLLRFGRGLSAGRHGHRPRTDTLPITSWMFGVGLDGAGRIWAVHVDGSSVQTALDGSRRIVWMIIGMIKGHPTENRMPRRPTWPDGKRRACSRQ
jgi:hypothetical protein